MPIKMLSKYLDVESLIHGIKALTATMIGVLFIKLFGIGADIWIVITIVVIMCAQIYVGSVLHKSYFRFLGTLIGCLFAIITLLIFGVNYISILVSVGLSVLIFSYLATKYENLMYACTLGAVTTVVIMLNPQPTMLLALQRFLEISTGIFIASLVSQFILPIRASTHLRRTQAKTLTQLRDYYLLNMMTKGMPPNDTELEENIIKTLLKQRQLAKECVTEPFHHHSFSPTHFMQSLYYERELLRDMTLMHKALLHLKNDKIFNSPFHHKIIQTINELIAAINTTSKIAQPIDIPTINDLKDELQNQNWSQEELFYLHGYLFSVEILLDSLTKFIHLHDGSKLTPGFA